MDDEPHVSANQNALVVVNRRRTYGYMGRHTAALHRCKLDQSNHVNEPSDGPILSVEDNLIIPQQPMILCKISRDDEGALFVHVCTGTAVGAENACESTRTVMLLLPCGCLLGTMLAGL